MEDLKAKGEKPTPPKVQRIYKGITAKREIEATLRAVKHAGGHAEYIPVDITCQPDLEEKLAEPVHRLGPITGIIHGAGNLADKLIEKKSVSDFEIVFSAKINGLENMLASVPVSQLDFLVLFSSIVGFYGNVGQADYAMANEILNKTAHYIKRKYPTCHVVSIGWGPWDSGMVTPELKRAFEERHIQVISTEAGANLLVNELMPSDQEPVQVLVGNFPAHPPEEPNPVLQHYEIRRRLTPGRQPVPERPPHRRACRAARHLRGHLGGQRLRTACIRRTRSSRSKITRCSKASSLTRTWRTIIFWTSRKPPRRPRGISFSTR